MKLRTILALVLLLTLAGCASSPAPSQLYTDHHPMTVIPDEAVALADSPSPDTQLLYAQASGSAVTSNMNAVIDYSNTADGYVMVRYNSPTEKRLKAQVKGPAVTYTYNLTPGEWAVFPLAEGDGDYTVILYIQAEGNKYASVLSQRITVKLNSEFLPFLYPNQYVNYGDATETVKKASELTANLTHTLEKVAAIYNFTVDTLTYDKEKAASVKSGYLPVLDQVLAEQKGICFDYAALMAGMLRSQNIPCKLVVGYAGKTYHAWISVWSEEEGWIDGVIRFDGTSWQRMDPTFASSAAENTAILDYIGDSTNYTAKYLY